MYHLQRQQLVHELDVDSIDDRSVQPGQSHRFPVVPSTKPAAAMDVLRSALRCRCRGVGAAVLRERDAIGGVDDGRGELPIMPPSTGDAFLQARDEALLFPTLLATALSPSQFPTPFAASRSQTLSRLRRSY